MKMDWKKYRLLFFISVVTVGLDQISKIIVLKSMTLYQSIPVIPGFFNFTYIRNPGGAFGFFANQSPAIRSFVFIFVSLLAIGFILYFYINTPDTHKFLATGFSLIFGGAIGNMIDRLRFGTVVDFLDVYIQNTHWPAFNIADSAISIGMAIFIYHVLTQKMPADE